MSVLPVVSDVEDPLDTWMAVMDAAAGAGPERLIEQALTSAASALQATKACVAVYRAPYKAGDLPLWAVTVGCDGATGAAVAQHFSSAIVQRALEGGRAFSTPSALGDPRFAGNHSVRIGRITSVVCAPLATATPAVLCLQNPPRGTYQRGEVSRVEELVRRLSPLVDRLAVREDVRSPAFQALAGRSASWLACVSQAEGLARQDVPVLVSGEQGSGRRTLARAVHLASARATGPRVDIHAPLLGAVHVRKAVGGTLLVENLEQLGDDGRTVLLELFGRPAADRPRLIATRTERSERQGPGTSDNLDALLFHAVVKVPSLEERAGDTGALIEAIGRRASEEAQLAWQGCTAAAIDKLRRRRWPGNVAELATVVTRAVGAARGACPVGLEHLTFESEVPVAVASGGAMGELFPDGFVQWKEAKHRFEDWYLQRALREFGGHRALTAAQLQMGRATLFEVLKRTGAEASEDVG